MSSRMCGFHNKPIDVAAGPLISDTDSNIKSNSYHQYWRSYGTQNPPISPNYNTQENL